jgi:hypothetical protein
MPHFIAYGSTCQIPEQQLHAAQIHLVQKAVAKASSPESSSIDNLSVFQDQFQIVD